MIFFAARGVEINVPISTIDVAAYLYSLHYQTDACFCRNERSTGMTLCLFLFTPWDVGVTKDTCIMENNNIFLLLFFFPNLT